MSKQEKEPLSPAERKRRERARKAAAGIAEVRGIHAHTDDHDAIRQQGNETAARLAKRRAAAAKKQAKGESK